MSSDISVNSVRLKFDASASAHRNVCARRIGSKSSSDAYNVSKYTRPYARQPFATCARSPHHTAYPHRSSRRSRPSAPRRRGTRTNLECSLVTIVVRSNFDIRRSKFAHRQSAAATQRPRRRRALRPHRAQRIETAAQLHRECLRPLPRQRAPSARSANSSARTHKAHLKPSQSGNARFLATTR